MAQHGAGTVDRGRLQRGGRRGLRGDVADLPNVHIVQANVFQLPFRKEHSTSSGRTASSTTRRTREGAHAALAELVRARRHPLRLGLCEAVQPVQVHEGRARRTAGDAAAGARPARIARGFSYVSIPLLAVYRAVRRLPGLQPRSAWGLRTVRPRTVRELQLTWFDALSPEFDSRHSEAEVIGWFRHRGFDQIESIEEPKVGVRGVRTGAGRPGELDGASAEGLSRATRLAHPLRQLAQALRPADEAPHGSRPGTSARASTPRPNSPASSAIARSVLVRRDRACARACTRGGSPCSATRAPGSPTSASRRPSRFPSRR